MLQKHKEYIFEKVKIKDKYTISYSNVYPFLSNIDLSSSFIFLSLCIFFLQ